jgi:predicted nucleic acid-binding protein
MKVLFDTSVLVAAIVEAHSRHAGAAPWLRRAKAGEIEFLASSHSGY